MPTIRPEWVYESTRTFSKNSLDSWAIKSDFVNNNNIKLEKKSYLNSEWNQSGSYAAKKKKWIKNVKKKIQWEIQFTGGAQQPRISTGAITVIFKPKPPYT